MLDTQTITIINIFWFLFGVAVTNSYILLRHYRTQNRLTSKEFQIELAKSLIGDCNSRNIRGRPSSSSIPNPIRPCPIKHFPVKKKKKHPVKKALIIVGIATM